MPTYLHHFVLDDIADVFDANALWHAPGLPLFARKCQLRDLLERNPRLQKGRSISSCFSHVRLWLPSALLDDDDHLFRSSHKNALLAALTALHERDFANLLDGQSVRYEILADASLGEHQVALQFGHALYLPAAKEVAQYQVLVSTDSAVWQSIGQVYPQQRLCLLGCDAQQHSLAVPHWPSSLAGALLLINDGPECALQWRVRPQAAFDLRFDEKLAAYVLSALGNRAGVEVGQARRLLLKVQLVAQGNKLSAPIALRDLAAAPATTSLAARPLQVWQARPVVEKTTKTAPQVAPKAARQATTVRKENSSVTAYPQQTAQAHQPVPQALTNADLTYVAQAAPRSSMRLVALALPRLSRYPQAGVARLAFGFAQDMRLQTGAHAALNFSVDAQDQIQVSSKAGQQNLTAPAHFEPIAGQALDLMPVNAAMQDLYAACLRLPSRTQTQVQLPNKGRTNFGRSASSLTHLRVLDGAGIALDGELAAESADRIGLSRIAFSVAVEEQGQEQGRGFHIWRESEGQVLFHLDENLELVQAIASAQYLLPNGHHVVAGHYVLQLQTQAA